MSNKIDMKQYGLSESFEKSADNFADLTVSRVLSQGKGIFRDCTHSGSEPGCAVQEAIGRGELPIDRLNSYQKLMNENRYMENSQGYLAEKKKKFKTIAKINKRNRKG